MNKPPEHSPAFEAALGRTVESIYGAGPVDFEEGRRAMDELLAVDASGPSSASQQLALGVLISDMSPSEEQGDEEEEDAIPNDAQLPERILMHRDGKHILDQVSLMRIAAALLARRSSTRDAVMAYCAMRNSDYVPSEGGELYAMTVARNVAQGAEATDALTRVYSRRVLALIAEDADEVMAMIRQAQEEGNAFEVVQLVESAYRQVPPQRAMSLIGIGVNAAEELEDEGQVRVMYGMLFKVIHSRFHALYNASECNEHFERNAEAHGLVGELQQLLEAFGRMSDTAKVQMGILAELAMARALLAQFEAAEEALFRLRALAANNGGLSAELEAQLHHIQAAIDQPITFDESASEETDEDDDHDEEEDDPADFWK